MSSIITRQHGNANQSFTFPWVTIQVFSQMVGYSSKAVRNKIARGQWMEGTQYKRAPDGRILISLWGVNEWIEGNDS